MYKTEQTISVPVVEDDARIVKFTPGDCNRELSKMPEQANPSIKTQKCP